AIAALHVQASAIVDFALVSGRLADAVAAAGGTVRLGERVTGLRADGDATVVTTAAGTTIRADWLVNCAGLHADRVARLAGVNPPARIIGFRGEYYELTPESRDLVNALIYPVPDPHFPFLGVH